MLDTALLYLLVSNIFVHYVSEHKCIKYTVVSSMAKYLIILTLLVSSSKLLCVKMIEGPKIW